MFKRKQNIRVRFAPSPTGAPHVGNIRTALFAWLFARHNKGHFILRIEDTDQARTVPGSLENILESLKWLGLDFDEGPIFQSQRLEMYKKYALELVEKNHAYYCFCTEDRLKQVRADQEAKKLPPKYDRHCLHLLADEIQKKLADNESHVIRMRVPLEGETGFEDSIKGAISFKNSTIDDQVLLKSDGFPTYHLASVVDDYEMKISHVIRAEEWLPSTPKHIMLYDYFGWAKPHFAHVPVILGTDKSKLSKRHGAVSLLDYRDQGYVPEAMVNYLAFLGWNPKTDQELFTREELIAAFDLANVNKANPIFDVKKLNWMNQQYIQKMAPEELFLLLQNRGSGKAAPHSLPAVVLAQERMEKLSDFENVVSFLETVPEYDPNILIPKKSDSHQTLVMLNAGLDVITDVKAGEWEEGLLRETFFAYCEAQNVGKGELLWPLRVAVTGLKNSPDVFAVMDILGKDTSRKRVEQAILSLRGASRTRSNPSS